MRVKNIKIPIYFGSLTIIQVDNIIDIGKKYGYDIGVLHGADACCFRDHKKNGYLRYVLVFENEFTIEQIAHESAHLVNYIFSDHGIKLDVDNDEPQAYLMGWIVNQCHKFLIKTQ